MCSAAPFTRSLTGPSCGVGSGGRPPLTTNRGKPIGGSAPPCPSTCRGLRERECPDIAFSASPLGDRPLQGTWETLARLGAVASGASSWPAWTVALASSGLASPAVPKDGGSQNACRASSGKSQERGLHTGRPRGWGLLLEAQDDLLRSQACPDTLSL